MADGFTSVTPEELLGPLDDLESKHAPARLYVAGDTTLVTKGVRVSIVGSRKASADGLKRAAKLSRLLVERGVVVASGLAEGIDTAAHTAAIEAGGRTLAVLGTPLDKFFPAKNRELQERIMREHLAVSQFEAGKSLGSKAFPMRNRTMALLSDATVIVEAGEKSGTIHQGWEAIRLARPLYIMESLLSSGPKWAEEMMGYGAEVLSDSTLELFFEVLPEGSRVESAEVTF